MNVVFLIYCVIYRFRLGNGIIVSLYMDRLLVCQYEESPPADRGDEPCLWTARVLTSWLGGLCSPAENLFVFFGTL